ncbi:MAG: V0D/AC39 family V-type ATPase subunit [Lachnospiraceae bacterium]|jgi:V/A-type H+-transporting ATPase subunit C
MSDLQYTYAVARIRALEVALFSSSTIDQLIACQNAEQCLQFLSEKGWGDSDTPMDAEAILNRESEKTWETIKEMNVDMSVFDVLSYPNLFHNLKAAIKAVYAGEHHGNIFYDDCAIPGDEMLAIVREKNFSRLPESMAGAAAEAYETLFHTGDGQLSDVIIDRAALEAIYQAGQEAKDEIIRDYAESTVAVANIKTAVRSQKTAKTLEFMKRAMAECESLSVDLLAKAAVSGMDAISEYLSGTAYAEGANALMESSSAFERWCDNRIIQTIQPQKYNSFSVGPLVAYVLARENEIKTVRIILSGKENGLSDDAIRERVREMYV